MRLRYWVVLLLSTLAFPQGGLTYVPITSTFADWDANGVPYDVRSDNRGSYKDHVDGVTTFLTSNGYNHQVYGDWQLDTYSSTTRMVSITFEHSNAVKPEILHTQLLPIRPFGAPEMFWPM